MVVDDVGFFLISLLFLCFERPRDPDTKKAKKKETAESQPKFPDPYDRTDFQQRMLHPPRQRTFGLEVKRTIKRAVFMTLSKLIGVAHNLSGH